MRKCLVFLFLAVIVPGAAFGQAVVCDRFEPNVILKGNQLAVSLDTDLPDWTQLMVSVSRSYWANTPPHEYSVAYLETQATVRQWRKLHNIDIEGATWRRHLDEQIQRLGAAGIATKIVRIDSNVTVSFVVPVNQTDSRFGPGNRNLGGKRVPASGLRVIEAERKIGYPLPSATRAGPAEFAAPDGLSSGVRYQISRETPLMPERNPEDPLRAMAAARRLPPGSGFVVLSIDRSEPSNVWYRVRALSTRGASLGSGWVNGIALIGQEITVVRP